MRHTSRVSLSLLAMLTLASVATPMQSSAQALRRNDDGSTAEIVRVVFITGAVASGAYAYGQYTQSQARQDVHSQPVRSNAQNSISSRWPIVTEALKKTALGDVIQIEYHPQNMSALASAVDDFRESAAMWERHFTVLEADQEVAGRHLRNMESFVKKLPAPVRLTNVGDDLKQAELNFEALSRAAKDAHARMESAHRNSAIANAALLKAHPNVTGAAIEFPLLKYDVLVGPNTNAELNRFFVTKFTTIAGAKSVPVEVNVLRIRTPNARAGEFAMMRARAGLASLAGLFALTFEGRAVDYLAAKIDEDLASQPSPVTRTVPANSN